MLALSATLFMLPVLTLIHEVGNPKIDSLISKLNKQRDMLKQWLCTYTVYSRIILTNRDRGIFFLASIVLI